MTSLASPVLEARGLSRRYGDRVAVDGLDFAVARGEILGFLGPNGAGKTTTFEILAGLRRADAGELRFHGEPVSPSDRKLRARTAVVFQRPSVDDKLTARENLVLGAAIYGVTGGAARARVEAALETVGLAGRADEPVHRFSGGMRRRLELARVFLVEPELLILDEPTEGLDPAFARGFWAIVTELVQRRGLAVLLTTHDAAEAEECDRLLILDKGKVIAAGTPEELKARVGGDVIAVAADNPEEIAEGVAALGLPADIVDGVVLVTHPAGHEVIPRIVESFPRGRLRSVGLRAPNLADVFVAVTGRTLD
jgi:ABC-2 type transport system ATP-binding protein